MANKITKSEINKHYARVKEIITDKENVKEIKKDIKYILENSDLGEWGCFLIAKLAIIKLGDSLQPHTPSTAIEFKRLR